MQAAMFLAQQGWDAENLLNLEGGILAWARDVDPSLPRSY
jgi:rhodanese-related sulfurtransferase